MMVMLTADAQPGINCINTDNNGERSFSYWRKDSAATRMMSMLDHQGGPESPADTAMVYFCGISLPILSDTNKGKLLELVIQLGCHDARAAFDHHIMLENHQHAPDWI